MNQINPIRKVEAGGGCFTKRGYIPFRKWAWKCPECDTEGVPVSNYYIGGRNSRKTAKDALNKHRQTHGAPGLGV